MHRRKFLRTAALGTAGVASVSTLAAPAIAESTPELKWRMASSFPKSLDTLYGTGEIFARYISEMTDNKFNVRIFAAGEIVPGLQVLDAVQNGTVEMGHSAGTYYVGKDNAFAFDTALPFGNNSRQQEAWMRWGGGRELLNELYKDYNIYSLGCGLTGAQMGGWFRKEVKGVEDFKGLKFRIAGIAGLVINKIGGVAQQIAGGDIYPALEKGTIDGCEWVGPYDDEKLGFHKVAQYYYYPGWWEGGPMIHNFINLAKWNELPPAYRSVIRTASSMANEWMQARYDAANPAALKRLVAGGAQLRPFTQPIMDASLRAALDLYAEVSKSNPDFKKVWEAMLAFRNDQYLGGQGAELTYDTSLVRNRTRT